MGVLAAKLNDPSSCCANVQFFVCRSLPLFPSRIPLTFQHLHSTFSSNKYHGALQTAAAFVHAHAAILPSTRLPGKTLYRIRHGTRLRSTFSKSAHLKLLCLNMIAFLRRRHATCASMACTGKFKA